MPNTVKYNSQGKSLTAELYAPTGAAPDRVVVLCYGSDGLTNNLSGPWDKIIKEYADALAQSGIAVMIPDYLAVTGTKPGPDTVAAIFDHRDKWQAAINDAIEYARTSQSSSSSRVGLLGFSLGGHLCLRLRSKVSTMVEFFTPFLDGLGTPGGLAHAQIHHGESDGLVLMNPNASGIKNLLVSEGTQTELFTYPGAVHGFTGTDHANTDARALSNDRIVKFFQSHL